jgi:predicted HAD superfamily phosphohydrolase YqeG
MSSGNAINIFVDVDDTLVRSTGAKRIPIPSVVQHVRDLHTQGAILYCWSAGGAEYAQRSAEELGIAQCFSGFLPKPNIFIDDQNVINWPRSFLIHPANCSSHTLDTYKDQLK